jgi:hypothetical protein
MAAAPMSPPIKTPKTAAHPILLIIAASFSCEKPDGPSALLGPHARSQGNILNKKNFINNQDFVK